ncbi:membrane protein [Alsobacter metallidurans]|uniref:Membrane protein n=1 Tax=Alsobacter metallidurans TaxID=340221 RepID=A0A917I608_9HYPH|nr:FtsX-like permease family protein [Alsobacter metallidurans]GGH16062.1 membrane protein [Alsobacter metallidurans]
MNPFPLIGAELRRSWPGALALFAVMAFAIAMGVTVIAQERALRQGSARAADDFDLLIGAPGSETQLVLTGVYLQESALPLMPDTVWSELARRNGVTWAAPLVFGDTWRGRPVIGTTADFVTRGGKRTPEAGRLFQADHEAVVGSDVPLAIGAGVVTSHGHSRDDGRALPGEARHEGHELIVVGRMPRTGTPYDRAILAPIEAVWEAHGLARGRPDRDARIGPPWPEATGDAPVIVVKAASVADAYRLRAAFRGGRTMAVFPAEVLVQLYGALADVKAVMAAMALATQALVFVSVLVCVFALASARRRDIAVLRAIGAPRAFVFAVVWLGVCLLVCAAALAGIAMGYVATAGASALLSERFGFMLNARIGPDEWAMTALAAVLGALLALVPAAAAYRGSVVTGLRGG